MADYLGDYNLMASATAAAGKLPEPSMAQVLFFCVCGGGGGGGVSVRVRAPHNKLQTLQTSSPHTNI